MKRTKSAVLILFWFACVFVRNFVNAGPASNRRTRTVREVYPEIEAEIEENQSQVCIVGDVVYGVGEPVPAEQPCLKCKCQAPGVLCDTIRCSTKKPGCKAIHRPNQCCPDYLCECSANGKLYTNGEIIETQPEECKVCYCQGGEISCTDVSCYHRSDCEGRRVLGQCCPSYDHCPPKDLMNGSNDTNSVYKERRPVKRLPQPIELTTKKTFEPTIPPQEEEKNKNQITIHEIIPEILEIPMTSPPRTPDDDYLNPRINTGTLILEDPQNDLDLEANDSRPDSSEVVEIIQEAPESVWSTASYPTVDLPTEATELYSSTTELTSTMLKTTEAQELKPRVNNDLAAASSSNIISFVKRKKLVTTTTKEPVIEISTEKTKVASTTNQEVISSSSTIEEATLPSTESHQSTTDETFARFDGTMGDDLTEKTPTEETNSKILPEVLEIRSNKTVQANTTNSDWLKSTAAPIVINPESIIYSQSALPSEILNEPVDGDVDYDFTTIDPISETSTILDLTMIDLNATELEATTAQNESRSVENVEEDKSANLKEEPKPENNDKAIRSEAEEMLIIPPQTTVLPKIDTLNMTSSQRQLEDVELIDVKPKQTTPASKEPPKPEKLVENTKNVNKRANQPKEETDEVFKQLDEELNGGTVKILTKEEEDKEAKEIFRELLEEAEPQNAKPKTKQQEALDKVTNAFGKLALRGGRPTLDTSILGVLGDFFGSQARAYNSRSGRSN